MFRKREKVVYPRHGAGKIIDKYETKVGDEKNDYYKVEFFNSKVDISIPVDKAKELGLREPNSKYKIKKILKKLGKKVTITNKLIKALDIIAKEKLMSGKLEDTVELINMLNSLANKKEKENKNFSYSASQRLEMAREFLLSEVELVLGKKAAERFRKRLEK
jgi:CarD family transcriptional regulator